jgi:hypothetical protein
VVLVSVLNALDALYAAAAHPLVATAPKAVSLVAYGASFMAEDAAHFQRVGVDACLVRRPRRLPSRVHQLSEKQTFHFSDAVGWSTVAARALPAAGCDGGTRRQTAA